MVNQSQFIPILIIDYILYLKSKSYIYPKNHLPSFMQMIFCFTCKCLSDCKAFAVQYPYKAKIDDLKFYDKIVANIVTNRYLKQCYQFGILLRSFIMKSSQKVIDYLNFLLGGELGARDQYFIHAQMYAEWSFGKLYDRIYHEMQDETGHAQLLIQRILMLGGKPNMKVGEIQIGSDVPSMLKSDLELEYRVQEHLKEGIALCETERDYVTRDILVRQLEDTEQDHAHWLEKQLRLIDLMGLQNYLQSVTAEADQQGNAH